MLKIIVERHQELPPVAMPMLPYLSVDRGGKLVPLKSHDSTISYLSSDIKDSLCFLVSQCLIRLATGRSRERLLLLQS